tara:strand:+ start:702 stop:1157 length:456 start_codon:yes stop_codon:yes gene_type:complete
MLTFYNIKIFIYLLIIIFSFSVHANLPEASISNFNSPIYNDKGELTSEIIGYKANIISKNKIEIEHVIINLFESKKKIASLYSSICLIESESSGNSLVNIFSNTDVIIEYESFYLTGNGFKYDPQKNFFEVFGNVKLIVDPKLISEIDIDL